MEQFIESLDKFACVLLSIIFDPSGFYGSYNLIYSSENMEEKQLDFIQRLKLSKMCN